MQTGTVRIGTRGSPLALAQAEEVKSRIAAAGKIDPAAIEIVVMSTAGDRIQDRPLAEVGGKGLFTAEIEAALLGGEIDLAVHSSKDMPTVLPDGLALTAFLEREDVRDAFLSRRHTSLDSLPEGARVGSSSLRRQALLKRARPDLEIVGFRGNVQTRLRKLDEGIAEATLLANAGLRRLGLGHEITELLDTDRFLPAPGQGAICVETRTGDARTDALVGPLDHGPTSAELACERAFLAALDGSCRTPIAGLARVDAGRLVFRGMILTPDGSVYHEIGAEGRTQDAASIGRTAGETIRARAGTGFFEAWT